METFEINLGRCILCGICVEVCAFDAIVMSHEHEISSYARNGRRADLKDLLEMGKRYQQETGWRPPTLVQKEKEAALKAAATGGGGLGEHKERGAAEGKAE
mgnify:CR=1 FL=1